MPSSLELARRHERVIASLISHRLPLAEGVEAYRSFAAREPGWTKVVLLPGT
jgi:threonine dehydrogenase-like Zn-dependent dehydrogenase